MENGDEEFEWFVMDGYGRYGYQESSIWYRGRLLYQLMQRFVRFHSNLHSHGEKNILQIHNKNLYWRKLKLDWKLVDFYNGFSTYL